MGTAEQKSKTEYKHRGARALVLLHEEHIRSFLKVWRDAKRRGVKLPETDDPDYISMETLLMHVLRSSGGYMKWICDKLSLPDPKINQVPSEEVIEKEAEGYIEHLLERWSLPLALIEDNKVFETVHRSNWGVEYSIEAMLEHAVMHPIRHGFQLKNI
ncbi:MAG: hypothetical protein ACM3S2_11025 [Ignavibacteriales bacterium]